jgi:hypothetical protein
MVSPRHHGGVASHPVWCRLVTTVVSPRPLCGAASSPRWCRLATILINQKKVRRGYKGKTPCRPKAQAKKKAMTARTVGLGSPTPLPFTFLLTKSKVKRDCRLDTPGELRLSRPLAVAVNICRLFCELKSTKSGRATIRRLALNGEEEVCRRHDTQFRSVCRIRNGSQKRSSLR